MTDAATRRLRAAAWAWIVCEAAIAVVFAFAVAWRSPEWRGPMLGTVVVVLTLLAVYSVAPPLPPDPGPIPVPPRRPRNY